MAGARLARNEGAAAAARREMRSTMPADLPPSQRSWLSDRPSWCVDLGPTLVAMTTCELWLALAKGDVGPTTKVWREGMPWWDPVESVPEFALALPDASVWSPVPASGTRPAGLDREIAAVTAAAVSARAAGAESVHMAGATGAAGSARARGQARGEDDGHEEREDENEDGESERQAGSAHVAEVTMAPANEHLTLTPAPVVVGDDGHTPQPASGPRRIFPRLDRRGIASVAFGALVAILALTAATTGPAPGRATAGHGAAALGAAGPRAEEPRAEGPRADELRAEGPRADEGAMDPRETKGIGARPEAVTVTAAKAEGPAMMPPQARPEVRPETSARAPRGPHAGDRGQRRVRGGMRETPAVR